MPDSKLKIILASNNASKLKEYEGIFSMSEGIELLSPKEAGVCLGDPDESAGTYEGNALIKAEAAGSRAD